MIELAIVPQTDFTGDMAKGFSTYHRLRLPRMA